MLLSTDEYIPWDLFLVFGEPHGQFPSRSQSVVFFINQFPLARFIHILNFIAGIRPWQMLRFKFAIRMQDQIRILFVCSLLRLPVLLKDVP